jgi:hypothetical protein
MNKIIAGLIAFLVCWTSSGLAGTMIESEAISISATAVVANGALTPDIPAGYAIERVYVVNTTANAVTGGISIGTSALGSDVVVALAVPANSFALIPLASVLKNVFSTSASQTLFISAVGSWNSASINVVVKLQRAVP